jgi:hypothetical protein
LILTRDYQVEQRAIGWAFEKMAEDNLYWALVDARWFDETKRGERLDNGRKPDTSGHCPIGCRA